MRVLGAMLCLILYGCGQNPRLGPVELEGSISQDTVISVTSYGAIGNDNLDDTRAFRDAIAALPFDGGVIRIPAGVYLLSASSEGVNRALDLSLLRNVTIEGEGLDRTVLRMTGASYVGDTHLVFMDRAANIAIRDLALDGDRESVRYSDEQSHGVEILGSSNIVFERVLFTRMYGDGIRMVGAAQRGAPWVDGVRIEACRFQENGRSGITVQRGVRGLRVLNSTFTKMSDQSIDMEPTGGYEGSDIAPRDFEITENHFFDTAPLAVTLAGITAPDPARNLLFADNQLDDTGILVFNAHNVTIERNVIRSGNVWRPIEVMKGSEFVWILENQIDARNTRVAAISLEFHTSRAPKDIHIVNNSIQTASDFGVYARDSERVWITGNTILGSGIIGVGIDDIVPDSPLAGFLIEENHIAGFDVGIRFMSRQDPLSNACARNNDFDLTQAVVTEGPVSMGCTGF